MMLSLFVYIQYYKRNILIHYVCPSHLNTFIILICVGLRAVPRIGKIYIHFALFNSYRSGITQY